MRRGERTVLHRIHLHRRQLRMSARHRRLHLRLRHLADVHEHPIGPGELRQLRQSLRRRGRVGVYGRRVFVPGRAVDVWRCRLLRSHGRPIELRNVRSPVPRRRRVRGRCVRVPGAIDRVRLGLASDVHRLEQRREQLRCVQQSLRAWFSVRGRELHVHHRTNRVRIVLCRSHHELLELRRVRTPVRSGIHL